MARRPTQMQAIRALLAKLEPELAASFEAAVADLYAGIDFRAFLSALESGNITAAIEALNIEPAAFQRYATVKTAAFAEAGAATAATISIPGVSNVGIRFDLTNPRAEAWIRENVAERVVAVVDEAKEAVREAIGSGYQAGRNPRDIARDIAGRSVRGGPRQGGIVGLDRPRAARLLEVSRGMETAEGVRDLVIKHADGSLSVRYKVNAATEKRILRAYNAGTEVKEADRLLSIRQYENALLKARADTIAQTETLQAVMSARDEEWRQTLDKIGGTPEDVEKTWRHGGGPQDPRPSHVAMNGKTVVGLDTPFEFNDGYSLQYAGDPNGPARGVIRCTCNTEFRIRAGFRRNG